MTPDVPQLHTALSRSGLLPADAVAVFLAGSLARGWANAASDVDVYVVTPDSPEGVMGASLTVALDPPTITSVTTDLHGMPCDLKYWTESQVRQTLDKVRSRPAVASVDGWATLLSKEELVLLERLFHAMPLVGEAWVAEQLRMLQSSSYHTVLVERALNYADSSLDDAAGQLLAGDALSATLSARIAFGHTVEAVLACHGEYGRNPKWRARRVREVDSPVLPFAMYWHIETMRDLDPEQPERWVRQVIMTCRRLHADIPVGGLE